MKTYVVEADISFIGLWLTFWFRQLVTLCWGGQPVAIRCRCSEVWLQDSRSEQQAERPSLFISDEMMLQPQPHIDLLIRKQKQIEPEDQGIQGHRSSQSNVLPAKWQTAKRAWVTGACDEQAAQEWKFCKVQGMSAFKVPVTSEQLRRQTFKSSPKDTSLFPISLSVKRVRTPAWLLQKSEGAHVYEKTECEDAVTPAGGWWSSYDFSIGSLSLSKRPHTPPSLSLSCLWWSRISSVSLSHPLSRSALPSIAMNTGSGSPSSSNRQQDCLQYLTNHASGFKASNT